MSDPVSTLPGVELSNLAVHSAPLPQPGYPIEATVALPPLPPGPSKDGTFISRRRKIQRPRLDRPQASLSASSVADRYGYPLVAKSDQWVAFISLGGGISGADVKTYCTQYGFPVPPVRVVSVDGAQNSYSGDPNSADGENALDLQNIIGATKGKVGVLMYIAPNSGSSFSRAVAQVAVDNVACACSISWGSDASNDSAADLQAMDNALQACNAKNIPCFAASGDDGSSDGSAGANVDFPASSPYAIGCGGTTLSSAGEIAWTYGGGGFSKTYPKPPWQITVPGDFRGVPDVAANGDPNTGYPIVISGRWQTFGGTSAVGPMWAAATALIVTITGKRIVNLAKTIYETNLLTDVIAGTNGAWHAGPGWDACTGEGVPNKKFFDFMVTPPVVVVPPPPPPPASGLPPFLNATDAAGNVLGKYKLLG